MREVQEKEETACVGMNVPLQEMEVVSAKALRPGTFLCFTMGRASVTGAQ